MTARCAVSPLRLRPGSCLRAPCRFGSKTSANALICSNASFKMSDVVSPFNRSRISSAASMAPFEPSTIHLQIEAIDAALEIRDRLNGDTTSDILNDALEQMRAFAEVFDPNRHGDRKHEPGLSRKGDTAHLAVIDKDGLAVSLIQSLFFRLRNVPYGPSRWVHITKSRRCFQLGARTPSSSRARSTSTSHAHGNHMSRR